MSNVVEFQLYFNKKSLPEDLRVKEPPLVSLTGKVIIIHTINPSGNNDMYL